MRDHQDAHESVTYELVTDRSSAAARKYHIWTIGCQMNVADSNHVAAELEKIGYGPTDRLDDAELLHDEERLYRLSDGPEWPFDLGPEPEWLAAEHDEIDDALADEHEASVGYDWTRRTAYAMAIEGGRI